jgi:His/Glu/Gln/Arg/opine family amino acid ABC transporter permease subunit
MMNILPYLPQLASGLSVTLILMLASLCAGLFFAIIFTIVSYSDTFFLKKCVDLLVFFIRGTPLLVQIFFIYYGAGQFEWIRSTFLWTILREPMACAIIALSLNSACYTTILLQGAIQSVPKNEIAACEAIGMRKWLAFRRIIFPRAFRLAIPAYSNEVIMILKGTSLASTITLLDVMGMTQQLIAETYSTVEFYLIAALIYLILNGIITGIFRILLHWSVVPQQSH